MEKNKQGIINKILICLVMLAVLSACKNKTWNDPHVGNAAANVRYTSFSEAPKTLDPARSYSEEEALFIAQIYEPPLQYHYLLRPYRLEPLTATALPIVTYLDAAGKPLPKGAPLNAIAFTRYTVHLKPGIFYQPHPAFAQDEAGHYLYLNLNKKNLNQIQTLADFHKTGTRELTADDYVYEIKRLASPKVNSPIFGLMSNFIVGFNEYAKTLQQAEKNKKDNFLDLRQYPLKGVQVIDRYTYSITIRGQYPQFLYWLAMNFFAPIPWEADQFYSQPGLQEKNITFDWHPVGTGPFLLSKNNPNLEMVLQRNPNFHGENFPTQGMPEDYLKGLMVKAGQPLPFIDKFVFSLEKESIPRWNKFLQGYYDGSAISSDSFDQAVNVDENNQPQLTPSLQSKKINLSTSVQPNQFFWGFNMLDDVVGGDSERARKLRQAISIAINTEEYITIFLNGRGMPAQGPIPPGIFGYQSGEKGMDPYIYDWRNHHMQRKSLDEARQLLVEAGYPNGRDSKTGRPLIINFDVPATAAPDDKARLDWMREQLAHIGIQLNVRPTQYNRFQEKIRTGNTQLFNWGWNADYPDPENFFFLFYGPNGKVKFGGENAVNYSNPEFDRLFEQMRTMPDGPERLAVIEKMTALLQRDAPWVWGFNPKMFVLNQEWSGPANSEAIGNNVLKYLWLNPKLRLQKQQEWNRPYIWPIFLLLILIALSLLPILVKYWQQQHKPNLKRLDGP